MKPSMNTYAYLKIVKITAFLLNPSLKNLNPQKSPGYDGISIKIIKTVAAEI